MVVRMNKGLSLKKKCARVTSCLDLNDMKRVSAQCCDTYLFSIFHSTSWIGAGTLFQHPVVNTLHYGIRAQVAVCKDTEASPNGI